MALTRSVLKVREAGRVVNVHALLATAVNTTAQMDAYVADPLRGFGNDTEAFKAVFAGVRAAADPARLAAIRSDLPIYVTVGDARPAPDRGALQHLASATVLTVDHGTIEFHDLQHDYLLLHERDKPPVSDPGPVLEPHRPAAVAEDAVRGHLPPGRRRRALVQPAPRPHRHRRAHIDV